MWVHHGQHVVSASLSPYGSARGMSCSGAGSDWGHGMGVYFMFCVWCGSTKKFLLYGSSHVNLVFPLPVTNTRKSMH